MFVKQLFAGVDRQYLVKSYIFGMIITALALSIADSMGKVIFCIVSFILFPFATIVWDDLMSTLMGGTVLILPLPIMIVWKMFKILMLYVFTILIAPLGMIYILYMNRAQS